MFKCKKMFSFTLVLVFVANASFANVYKKNLIFVNCTSADIQLDTTTPYKFSISPKKEATNGYADPYSITIPSQSVLKYKNMSVYFNDYIDGRMTFNFSGGVNGQAIIEQQRDGFVVNGIGYCPTGGNTITTSSVYVDKIKGVSNSADGIEFLNPEQIVRIAYNSSEYNTNDALIINLGCNSRS